jgi:hypothetical protein
MVSRISASRHSWSASSAARIGREFTAAAGLDLHSAKIVRTPAPIVAPGAWYSPRGVVPLAMAGSLADNASWIAPVAVHGAAPVVRVWHGPGATPAVVSADTQFGDFSLAAPVSAAAAVSSKIRWEIFVGMRVAQRLRSRERIFQRAAALTPNFGRCIAARWARVTAPP